MEELFVVRKAMVGANSILSWSPLPKRGSECGGRTNPQGTGSQATPLTPTTLAKLR
jgi:hypothetical protein